MELFGTAGIRGPVADRVTPDLALAVGRAVGRDGAEFVVGRDGRVTGDGLASAVVAGLESVGATAHRVGQVPTPTLAYASQGRRGVMLTASHNPPADNGIKLFVDGREYDRSAEQTVADRVEAERTSPTASADWPDWGQTRTTDVLSAYREAVTAFASRYGETPEDLTVAVDCGNGTASRATPQVLTSLGAEVVALNANVDGHFTARESKPTPESLTDLRNFVADGPADLGIGHDGDADRIVVVDSEGAVVHEDTVLAVLAEHYTSASDVADPVVVTTPNASGRIDERVEAAGGRVERVRLGALHEGIAAARRNGDRDTGVVFAAEPWKHVHTRQGDWIDGVASAAVFVRLVAEAGLESLVSPVTERPYRKESVRCGDEQKVDAMARIRDDLPAAFPGADVDTEYGVRLTFPDGSWTLVRPSGTEPYVRIYVESDDVDALLADVRDVVEAAVER
ncbi:phosphomannomutase [Halobacteriales archaeon Cl-PHB]